MIEDPLRLVRNGSSKKTLAGFRHYLSRCNFYLILPDLVASVTELSVLLMAAYRPVILY